MHAPLNTSTATDGAVSVATTDTSCRDSPAWSTPASSVSGVSGGTCFLMMSTRSWKSRGGSAADTADEPVATARSAVKSSAGADSVTTAKKKCRNTVISTDAAWQWMV